MKYLNACHKEELNLILPPTIKATHKPAMAIRKFNFSLIINIAINNSPYYCSSPLLLIVPLSYFQPRLIRTQLCHSFGWC